MEFRPCIDIHNGKVKQIVGGSLKDEGNMADENFVSGQDAVFYANLYKKEGFRGGHIILLNARDSEYYEATKKQAVSALQAYPGGLQVGGGITAENAEEFLAAGASHVIVTSYVFCDGQIKKASGYSWKRASGLRFKLQEKRWKVLYCDRPLAEVHRADDHRGFVRAACRLL